MTDTPKTFGLTNREFRVGISCGEEALVVGGAVPLGLVGAVAIRHRAKSLDSLQLIFQNVTFAARAKRRLVCIPIPEQS
jgi:hypothetical protein